MMLQLLAVARLPSFFFFNGVFFLQMFFFSGRGLHV